MKIKTIAIALSLMLGGASAAYAAEAMDCCKGKECCCKKGEPGAGEAGHEHMHHEKGEAKPEPKAR